MKTSYFPAKPNEMFSPELTALIRFVRCDAGLVCAHCGRKIPAREAGWTMLCDFRVAIAKKYIFEESDVVLKALSAVCGKHCFSPAIPSEAIGCFGYVVSKKSGGKQKEKAHGKQRTKRGGDSRSANRGGDGNPQL